MRRARYRASAGLRSRRWRDRGRTNSMSCCVRRSIGGPAAGASRDWSATVLGDRRRRQQRLSTGPIARGRIRATPSAATAGLPQPKKYLQMSRSTEARRLCRKRAMVVRYARKQGQLMSGRRRAKALIHLMYFAFRAWLALTTPCVAQTYDGLGSECPEFASRADGGNSGDFLHVVTAKILAPLSNCLLAARLQHGVARRGILR
jgi:hypothetical protein